MNKRMIERQARALIKDAIKHGTWYESESFEGDKVESQFLGTVFALSPSGKFYTPWANSNVDTCKRCKGTGCDYCGDMGSREAYEDSIFQDTMEETARKYNCWIESGEGDPCDIFIVRALPNDSEE